MEHDAIDDMLEQWSREWPELDRSAAAIVNRIDRISDAFDRRFKATLGFQGLGYSAFKLLTTLRRSGPPYRLTPTALSQTLLVASGTLTNQIDQLEKAGLAARSPDPTDRRGVLVGLTDEGRRRIDAALIAHARDERAALAALPEGDQAVLRRILRTLLVSLEEVAAESDRPPPRKRPKS